MTDTDRLAALIENAPVGDAPYVEEDTYVSGYAAGLHAAAAIVRAAGVTLAEPKEADRE